MQPGNPPAPYTVADIDTMWMLANVTETDSPAFHVGQEVRSGSVRFPVACSTAHHHHRRRSTQYAARPGALRDQGSAARAALRHVRKLRHRRRRAGASPAVPLNGVVREGDGTETVWVTADRRRFTKRTVKIGEPRDGYRQILEGVQAGELVATEGAMFLSNTLGHRRRTNGGSSAKHMKSD